ncbi:glycosyltransferase family 39 protein [Cryomorphaceae bacterium]|nr:glycosyltransferase family 39 protein [Cryomorphaceae bacterium]
MAKKAKKQARKASLKSSGLSARTMALVLFLISAAVYVNTLGHEFALDDSIVITGNEYTVQGFAGIDEHLTRDSFTGFFGNERDLVAGGRYRPMSLIFFSVEYALFGENPTVGHFLNILYYGLLVILLYFWLWRLLQHREHKFWSLPFIAALLFAVHPLHTEIVANIKGRDDIFALLGALGAAWFALRYSDEKKPLNLLWSGLLFFFGIMSKENTITFLAVIPLSLYYFRKPSVKEYVISLAPALLATAVFMALRISVVGVFAGGQADNLINNPFMEATIGERYGTTFYTLWRYLRLLFLPVGLTADYYPYHIPLLDFSDWRVWLGIVSNGALLIWALIKLPSRSIVSFGVLYYFITLSIVSNVFFTIGAFMNERFVFMSSVGWALAVAYGLIHFAGNKEGGKAPSALRYSVLGIALVFAVMSISRNRDWKNNETIYAADVLTSVNSCKANLAYGVQTVKNAVKLPAGQKRDQMLNEGIGHVERALEIYPQYIEALSEMGTIRFNQGRIDEAIDYYMMCMEVRNNQDNRAIMHSNINFVFERVKDPQGHLDAINRFLEYDTVNAAPLITKGRILENEFSRHEKAAQAFRAAAAREPENPDPWYSLGVIAYNNRNLALLDEAVKELSAREGQTQRVQTLQKGLN